MIDRPNLPIDTKSSEPQRFRSGFPALSKASLAFLRGCIRRTQRSIAGRSGYAVRLESVLSYEEASTLLEVYNRNSGMIEGPALREMALEELERRICRGPFLAIYSDFSGLPRAWGQAPTEADAVAEAARQRDAYVAAHPDNPLRRDPSILRLPAIDQAGGAR